MGYHSVLIVEDDMDIRGMLARFLSHGGYLVASAMTAAAVLAIIARQAPDIVLLDRMLPQESGHDLCHLIRDRSHAPIIMVTARMRAVLRRPSFPPVMPRPDPGWVTDLPTGSSRRKNAPFTAWKACA
ncbi:response regulator [Komagataeibacter swingsii]|nr:response regulator [Komagataeibacter swingsii]